MGHAVDGIEPCAKSEQEDVQCMCGIEIETVAGKVTHVGVIPNSRCRLCTGVSDHDKYEIFRMGVPWGVIVCNICMLICDEY
ncbi:MAG: hypothetical protein HXX08_03645 [Chloroflexi bacterium]|jgi:hypothetical protein|uniref:Uncharacterized protein n=1 Tax=Candidatus Chlorohelix allophototropha TaxID=3003348 RepID=A0A8T7M0L9_9CHLR|nr:hypothetical protein [Chloroflexota bacterium]WJW66832.1 hypothetical protein OZ401_000077 [Chloroflexota bacterium L227-S17]